MAAKQATKLYDAVGECYLLGYGDHVHIGLYDDRDSPLRPTWGEAQDRMVARLLELSGLQSAEHLLDIGCGHGATALFMAETLGCSIVGINISPFQINYANQQAQERGVAHRAQFYVMDGQRPPLPDGSFDVVVSVESAAYMADKELFVAEISRLLRPGGTLILSDFMRSDAAELSKRQHAALRGIDKAFKSAGNWHSAGQYRKIMAANGLDVIAHEDWTSRLRGFWDLSIAEVMLRRGAQEERTSRARGFFGNALVCLKKACQFEWAMLKGIARCDYAPLAMTVNGVILGRNKRTMTRAFGSGALQYQAIVAVKGGAPLAAKAATKAAAAAVPVLATVGSDMSNLSYKLGVPPVACASSGASYSSEASGSLGGTSPV